MKNRFFAWLMPSLMCCSLVSCHDENKEILEQHSPQTHQLTAKTQPKAHAMHKGCTHVLEGKEHPWDEQLFIDDLYEPDQEIQASFWKHNPFSYSRMNRIFQRVQTENQANPVYISHESYALVALTWNDLYTIEEFDVTSWSEPYTANIERTGKYFAKDPRVPEAFKNRVVQYIVIPTGGSLPDIPKDQIIKLDELYLPFEDKKINPELATKLEDTAMTNISNNPMVAKTVPAAKITYYDEHYDTQLGLPGVKVRAKKGFKVDWATTDENGFAQFSKAFGDGVKFRIRLETDDMNIRDGKEGKEYKGKGPVVEIDSDAQGTVFHHTQEWQLELNQGVDILYAHAWRAVYEMYHNNPHNLHPPYQKIFVWAPKMKIFVYDSEYQESYGVLVLESAFNKNRLRNWLEIYKHDIYGQDYETFHPFMNYVVTHEVSHFIHCLGAPETFPQPIYPEDLPTIDQIYVLESWANGPAAIYTHQIYPDFILEVEDYTESPFHTHIVRDLLDGFGNVGNNTDGVLNPDNPKPHDISSALYTPKQVQDAVLASKEWDEWKENLKDMYDKPEAKEDNLDVLFDYWYYYFD